MRALFSSPKARRALLLLALPGAACAPPGQRPAEILASLTSGAPEAALPREVLADDATPHGLRALLAGAEVEPAAVDGEAATVVARVLRTSWERCSEAERGAWIECVDLLPGESADRLALRFHFVRMGPQWHLDLRRNGPQR
jgi:hypothetical protein